jgi:hypothetical protein
VRRADRLGFALPDGAELLLLWYAVRADRRAGVFELVVDAFDGGARTRGASSSRRSRRTARPRCSGSA